MIWNAFDKYRDLGLLIVRLGIGLGFVYFHGWDKLSGGPERWAQVGGALDTFGIGFGHTFFGFMAAFSESIGGLLIAAGLFFRPICVLLAFTMFVAMMRHFISGRGNPGHAFKNMFILSGLLLIGPGKYSLDAWIAQKRGATDEAPAGA